MSRVCRRCGKVVDGGRGGCKGAQHGNRGCAMNNPDAHWLDLIDADEFCRDLAAAAAKQLARVRKEDRHLAVAHLQDATSLYTQYTSDRIEAALK